MTAPPPPPSRPSSREIAATAADWAARLDAGELTPPQRRALDAWLAGDVRALGALQRARALLLAPLPLIPGAGTDTPALDAPPPPLAAPQGRRGFLRLAAGIGGLAVLGGGAAGLLAPAAPAAAQTLSSRQGEIRRLDLPGGGALTLNTDSAVSLSLLEGRWRLRLTRGEVFIDLAGHERGGAVLDTPLVQVWAGETGAYALRLMDGGVTRLCVARGAATLTGALSPLAQRLERLLDRDLERVLDRSFGLGADESEVLVDAGQEAVLRPRHGGDGVRVSCAALPPGALERRLMWRDGRLAFQDDTLAQAVAEFARYSSRRIVVADERLARRHISGLFRVGDVEGFAHAAALSLDARIREEKEAIVLYI